MRRHPVLLGAGVLMSIGLLSGCGGVTEPETEGGAPVGDYTGVVEVVWITVSGKEIPCAVYDGVKAGGIHCMTELAE